MPNEIPDTDYIVRYCRPNTIINNQTSRASFQIRPNEDYVSANLMSKGVDVNVGLEHIRSILRQKQFEITANGRLVIFNVGIIKSYVYEFTGIRISICYKFSPRDPTHVGILPMNTKNEKSKQELMYSRWKFVK